MSSSSNNFSKNFENIVEQTIEINKQYLKEGTEIIKQISNSNTAKKDINLLQPENIVDTLTELTKLNLNHYKNMLDLSLTFVKKSFLQTNEQEDDTDDTTNETDLEPAFVLSATLFDGSSTTLKFVLENEKKEVANCRLINSEYVNDADTSDRQVFETFFEPQAFQLEAGNSISVNINIKVGLNAKAGDYTSKVQVIGFEPAYFLINLKVQNKINSKNETTKRRKK